MRYLTERDRVLAEAHAELHSAHGQQDVDAYVAAYQKKLDAEALEPIYDCAGCGKQWNGEGRLTACYVSLYEVQDGNTHWHQEHDRGNEHHLTWCPDCKAIILDHSTKR